LVGAELGAELGAVVIFGGKNSFLCFLITLPDLGPFERTDTEHAKMHNTITETICMMICMIG